MTNNELRETMWELCYDLLPAAEREALIAHIKSDPQAARLYAEVRLQADLVAAAAVVEDDALIVSPPADMPIDELHSAGQPFEVAASGSPKHVATAAVSRPRKHAPESVSAGRSSRSSRQSIHWLLATAALVLVGVMGYGLIRPIQSQHALADRYVVTEIEAPARMQSGLSSKVALKSRSVLGKSIEAHVDLKVVDPDGTVLFHEGVPTNADGEASVEIPGTAIVPGARLQAAGRNRHFAQGALDSTHSVEESVPFSNSIAVDLPVQAESPITYIWLEKPLGMADEPVQYAAVSLDRFSLRPVATAPGGGSADSSLGTDVKSKDVATYKAQGLGRSEQPLDGYLVEGTFDRGIAVLQGEANLDSLAVREQLARRGVASGTSTRSLEFRASEAQNAPTPADAAGSLAGGEAGQTKLAEADADAEGTPRGLARKEAAKKLADPFEGNASLPDNEPLAEVASATPPAPAGPPPSLQGGSMRGGGMGGAATPAAASAAGGFGGGKLAGGPAPGGSASSASGLGGSSPTAETKPQTARSFAAESESRSLSSLPIVPAGEPVTVELSEKLAGRKLLIQAINRDVVVATRSLAESPAATGSGSAEASDLRRADLTEQRQDTAEGRQFTLSLPPEADGQVQVEVLDLEQTPPQLVESFAYFRQPARELQIDFVSPHEAQAQFAPGDLVEMRLRVHNEQGEALPAALGIRVWNEAAIHETGEPVLLAEHVRRSQKLRFNRADTANRLAQLEAKESLRDNSLDLVRSKQFGQEPGATTFSAGAANEPRPDSPAMPAAGLQSVAESPPEVAGPSSLPAGPVPPQPALVEAAPAEAVPGSVPPSAGRIAAADSSPKPALQPTRPGDASGAAIAAEGYTPTAEATLQEAASVRMFDDAATASTGELANFGSTFSVDYDAQPVRSSNGIEVSHEYQSQQSAMEARWQAWRAIVGRILVIAGVLLMVGLAIQLWIRMPTRVLGVTLAMTAAAASLVVGAIWVGRPPAGYEVALGSTTASSPAASPAPRAMAPAGAESAEAGSALSDDFGSAARPANDYGFAPIAAGDAPAPAAGKAPASAPDLGFGVSPNPAAEPSFGRDESLPAQSTDGLERGRPAAKSNTEAESLASSRMSAEGLTKSDAGAKQERFAGPPSSQARSSGLADDRSAQQSAGQGARGAPSGGAAAVRMRSDPSLPVQSATPAPLPPAESAPLASQPGEATPPLPANDKNVPLAAAILSEGEQRAVAPASLYFNTRLTTDVQGFATITFQMPSVESDYRVLVDAIGDGRIGSRELRIQCRVPAAAAPAAELPTVDSPAGDSPSPVPPGTGDAINR